MNTRFSLSSEFWNHFVQYHWDQRPLLLKKPFKTPFATDREVFRCLVEASNLYRAGRLNLPLQFFNEQAFRLTGSKTGEYLPETIEVSAVDYAERVIRKLKGQRFAFILNGTFLEHDAQLWMRVRDFLRGLFEKIPLQSTHSALFLGNYESTPFGVHKDDKSNFQFVIEGQKKMHLWPDEFVRGEKELQFSHDYRRFLGEAVTLEAEAGDVTFWPSSYWHIGEPVGGLSVCLTVGLSPFPSPFLDVWKHLAATIEERLEELNRTDDGHFKANEFQGGAETILAVKKLATEALREIGQNHDFEQALKRSQLDRVTGFGSTEVPPALPWQALADDDIVCGYPDYPIMWTPIENHQIIVSANGHSFIIPADPRIIELIERLNSGVGLRIKSLSEEYAGTIRFADVEYEADSEGVRALLEKLYSLRTITSA
jgi:50S ribosomal protein L16 3-hydroxylase